MYRSIEIAPPSAQAAAACRARWARVAKPLGSLGVLEENLVRIAALTGEENPDLSRRAVAVFCADNGVVAQGVTQTDSSVTAVVAGNMAAGNASVCCMARRANCDVVVVDIGMANAVPAPGVLDRCVRRGTRDLFIEPALTRDEAICALNRGVMLAASLHSQGYKMVLTGEMGIGNTTTSAAMAAVLLEQDPARVTGRGAGLSTEGLRRKVEVISGAIARHRPDPNDALDVLCKVGGLDIAGLAGLCIGAAAFGMPVVLDGFISAVAALTAVRLRPEAGAALIASHVSAEPAGRLVLDALGLEPAIQAGLRLGEGTGAVMLLPLMDMTLAVYREMVTFEQTEIPAYQALT